MGHLGGGGLEQYYLFWGLWVVVGETMLVLYLVCIILSGQSILPFVGYNSVS